MIRTLVILFFLTNFTTVCLGQEFLLFHKNRFKEAKYEVGDVISFKVKGDKKKHTFQIKDFEDSLIVFDNYKIDPDEITHMYLDDKTRVWYIFRYKYQKIFMVGGIGYFAIDALNTGEISSNNLLIAGSLISAGILAKILFKDRISVKGKRRLVIIDY